MISLADQDVFEEVYKKYFPRLVVFALSFTGAEASAEDIVQDVFLKLHSATNSFEAESALTAFLYISVRNKAIDYLRRERRSATIEVEYSNQDRLSDELDGDLLYLLAQSLDDLPPQSRKVLGLLFENDLSYKEVATALDISPNTVKNMRRFALDLLRRKFDRNGLLRILLIGMRVFPWK